MKKQLVFEKLEKQDYATREAFNSLRTNLQFCGDDVKVVMFTSCTPNEGKSTVTTELCRSLGEDNKKVILIDADLRKSVMVGHYGIRSESEIFGLSHYLSGQKKKADVIYPTNIDNVDMSILSMGMTGDYVVAIEEGSNMVRVGTGIFGERNYY